MSGLPCATDAAGEDDGTGTVPIGPLLLPHAATRVAIVTAAPTRLKVEWRDMDHMDEASVAGFI
jgi:hypothetical protein